jgi:hypothetical protein
MTSMMAARTRKIRSEEQKRSKFAGFNVLIKDAVTDRKPGGVSDSQATSVRHSALRVGCWILWLTSCLTTIEVQPQSVESNSLRVEGHR